MNVVPDSRLRADEVRRLESSIYALETRVGEIERLLKVVVPTKSLRPTEAAAKDHDHETDSSLQLEIMELRQQVTELERELDRLKWRQ